MLQCTVVPVPTTFEHVCTLEAGDRQRQIRLELWSRCRADTPAMLHYETLLGSLYNTPPCWSIYICGLVFEHLLAQARTTFRSPDALQAVHFTAAAGHSA